MPRYKPVSFPRQFGLRDAIETSLAADLDLVKEPDGRFGQHPGPARVHVPADDGAFWGPLVPFALSAQYLWANRGRAATSRASEPYVGPLPGMQT
jgi:hypothetical protein